ncbi:restriction endonuclease subunit S [Acidithrix sp. C25]|uniref:restriction endonuclease subunit S n=1 Tax=Acidithrix sp. C25 TaxID=1671482 RepID=UPI00191BA773|nr:restriction endonuclease subunit S [Acidithrix sp. C25]
MSRIDDLIKKSCPDGVEVKTLGEAGKFIRGNGLQKIDLIDAGVPAIHYGQIHTTYDTWATETISFVIPSTAQRLRTAAPGDLVIATTSEDDEAVGKAVAWLGSREAAVSGDAYIYHHSLEPKYVSYFFQSDQFRSQKKRSITGTKVRRISGDKLATIRIPIPPLEVQREIVKVLDLFKELEAELEARQHQYDHYRRTLLTFAEDGVRWTTLGDVCTKVSSGGTPSSGRADYYGGDIPWLRTQEVDSVEIWSTGMTITEKGLRNSSAKWIPAKCVIVAMYGATAAKVAINAIPLTTNQACCNLQIDPSRAEYRYVFHWVANEYERLRALGEGSQSNLNAQKVKNYPIPIPCLDEQRRIVTILDNFDSLVNDLSIGLPAELVARRKQYEYYRDHLLAFREKVT